MKVFLFPIALLSGLAMNLGALELRGGPVASWGQTTALEFLVEGPTEWLGEGLRPEAGIEVGLTAAGSEVLVPVGLLWESVLERGWSWGAAVHAMAGSTVTGPTALKWGAEAVASVEWSWSPGIAVGLGAGARYVNPTVQFPLHAFVEWALDGEDTLEPINDQDKD